MSFFDFYIREGGIVVSVIMVVLIPVLIAAYHAAKRDKDDSLPAIGLMLSSVFFVGLLVVQILIVSEYRNISNKQFTLVVDVYFNPDKPTREVFTTWEEPIKLEYDESYGYCRKPNLRHYGSNVATISTRSKVLYKVNAPVEKVSYTYKIKKPCE